MRIDGWVALNACVPVKERRGLVFIDPPYERPDDFERAAVGKAMRAELQVSAARPDAGLSACGVILINPPWKLAAELEILLPALVEVLGRGAGRGHALDWLDRIAGRAMG